MAAASPAGDSCVTGTRLVSGNGSTKRCWTGLGKPNSLIGAALAWSAPASQPKKGLRNRTEFAREIQHVLRAALAVARHYGLEDEMLQSIGDTYDNLCRDGWIDTPDK
ncbi:hypothetical protein BH23CHL1_BH23CHL1_23460 [soil metagenome]